MVTFGMLWNDPHPKKSVEEKIADAQSAFIGKYKKQPTHCSVPPTWYNEKMEVSGLVIESSENVPLGNVFIGYPTTPDWWNR
jgi:hypothetical protein